MVEDEKWMQIAIDEANIARNEHEVPVGAVIVQNGKLIAQAHNQPILNNDATAHAEIQALRLAGNRLKNYRLINSTLYVTLEPCAMCLGALMNARIRRVVFGAYDLKKGVCGSTVNLSNGDFFNHKILIKGGILESTCSKLLREFFKNKRYSSK